MPRYVAFLRGVSPVNAKMPELKRCFEEAGFDEVRTMLSSGNVVFDSRATQRAALERRAIDAMERALGRGFVTFVRPVNYLQSVLASEPFAEFKLPPEAKCVVTFLRRPLKEAPELPIARGGARILKVCGTEVFTTYVPSENEGVFMPLLERSFGKDITTRTLDSVRKCIRAS